MRGRLRAAAVTALVGIVAACSSAPPAATTAPGIQTPASSATAAPGGSSSGTVTSSDGKATITIPAGALPSGVAASDIKIAGIPYGKTLAAYDLQPSGTQFVTPLGFEASVVIGPGTDDKGLAMPMVVIAGDSGYEVGAEQSATVDAATLAASIQASLPHFSVGYADYAPVWLNLHDPKDQVVSVPFGVGVELSIAGPTTHFLLNDVQVLAMPSDSSVDKVSWTAGPFLTKKDSDDAHWVGDYAFGAPSANFVCTGTGSTYVTFSAQVRWTGKLLEFKPSNPEYGQQLKPGGTVGAHPDRSSDVKNAILTVTVTSKPFQCKAGSPATPTPTPTPSPTPTVTPTPTPTATPTPIVPTDIPEGWISGLCLQLQKTPPPPKLLFTLYSYGLKNTNLVLTIDGVNNGQPTLMPFDSSQDGWVGVPLEVTGTGPLTIKSAIFQQSDGSSLDLTKRFTEMTKGTTLDPSKDTKWGPIC